MPGKSLEEMEGVVWGPPTFDSWLVTRCHELRCIPVDEFTPGDLRLMIGQNISSEILLPIALRVLELDPFVDASYFPGDLLSSVLVSDRAFLRSHPELVGEVRCLAERVANILQAGEPELDHQTGDRLLAEIKALMVDLGCAARGSE